MAQVCSDWKDDRGWMTDKTPVTVHMLSGHFEGEINCGP